MYGYITRDVRSFPCQKNQHMVDYVKRHLDEINEGGEHARLARGCWQFDEIAVKRLEKLRGFGISGVMEKVESDEIKELKVTNR